MSAQLDTTVAAAAKDVVLETVKAVAITAVGTVVGLTILSVTNSLVQKVQERRSRKNEEDLEN